MRVLKNFPQDAKGEMDEAEKRLRPNKKAHKKLKDRFHYLRDLPEGWVLKYTGLPDITILCN
jgi:hypothetical protein